MNVIFFVYFIGFLIAVFQDFKRREVDDWLNLFLFSIGFLYLFVSFSENVNFIFSFGIFLLLCALVCMGMYSARIFAGGDAKMLFSLSPLFFSLVFMSSLYNLLFFILLLFICGSVYSLFYSGYFVYRDFKKMKSFFIGQIKTKQSKFLLIFFVFFVFMGFYEKIFFLFSFLILFFIPLFAIAKSLDKYSMTNLVDSKYLKEGDWLAKDVKISNRLIKSRWEGLSAAEAKFLQRQNKKFYVKDGIPYAFSFLLALVVYYFKNYLLLIFT